MLAERPTGRVADRAGGPPARRALGVEEEGRHLVHELVRELRGRLSGQFIWGSDFPFITPERCLAELDGLGLPDDVLEKLLRENALRILGA